MCKHDPNQRVNITGPRTHSIGPFLQTKKKKRPGELGVTWGMYLFSHLKRQLVKFIVMSPSDYKNPSGQFYPI